jgi:chromosome segregation ATPase
MTAKMDESSMVETLRLKTEEVDMDQYLKTKLGGYTKQSVLEYLNILRKQQQTTADTFYRNLQTVYNEKESINKSNEALQYQLNKIELEYKNLTEAMSTIQLEDSNLTMQDVLAVKNKSAVLEEELKKSNAEKTSLTNEIKHLNNSVNDMMEKLEQSDCEMAAAREMISAEKQESKELRDKVVALTIVIEDKNDEIKYLKALQTEGQVAELTSHINDLTNQLMTQTEVMATLNSEGCMKQKAIETLTAETELQKQMLYDLNKTVEELQYQNEKLLLANVTFTEQLQEGTTKTIHLIQEKSDVTIKKITANRKLDEANAKIAMLEMQIQKNSKLEEMKGC